MTMKRLVAAIILVIGIFIAIIGCGPTPNISGTWTGVLIFDQGTALAGVSYTLTLHLIQEGNDLSGYVGLGSGISNLMIPIVSGNIAENSISITAVNTATVSDISITTTINLDGQYTKTEMSGTGNYTSAFYGADSGSQTFTWQAQSS